MKVHPIQLEYRRKAGKQTCGLCGSEEIWTARAAPLVDGADLERTIHLTHLVRNHISEVQGTFSRDERKREVST